MLQRSVQAAGGKGESRMKQTVKWRAKEGDELFRRRVVRVLLLVVFRVVFFLFVVVPVLVVLALIVFLTLDLADPIPDRLDFVALVDRHARLFLEILESLVKRLVQRSRKAVQSVARDGIADGPVLATRASSAHTLRYFRASAGQTHLFECLDQNEQCSDLGVVGLFRDVQFRQQLAPQLARFLCVSKIRVS